VTPTRNNHGDRLGALEAGYKNLGREIHGLREDFQSFAGEIRRQLTTQQRTPWPAIIAAVAVGVSVIGGLITLGANGPLRELERQDLEIRRIENRLTDDFRRELDLRFQIDGRTAATSANTFAERLGELERNAAYRRAGKTPK
jgi:hypothetical protein